MRPLDEQEKNPVKIFTWVCGVSLVFKGKREIFPGFMSEGVWVFLGESSMFSFVNSGE